MSNQSALWCLECVAKIFNFFTMNSSIWITDLRFFVKGLTRVTMFIKSVILDGFKSYGKRTEINGFDPEFTAITGLNGTGKSNVLDAICFVLGISNLGQVCGFLIFCQELMHQFNNNSNECRFERLLCKSLFLKVGRPVLRKQPLQFFLTTRMLINVPLATKNAEKLP